MPLAEALQVLEDTLAGLTEEDWGRPTLLRTADPDTPPWNVLQLASHFDIFMGLVLNLVAEAKGGDPTLDRASFCISVSDSSQGPVLYQYMADHAKGHTPETMLDTVRATFKEASGRRPRGAPGSSSAGRPLNRRVKGLHRTPRACLTPRQAPLDECAIPECVGQDPFDQRKRQHRERGAMPRRRNRSTSELRKLHQLARDHGWHGDQDVVNCPRTALRPAILRSRRHVTRSSP